MNELELFDKIKLRDKAAFDALFRAYYAKLCRFSFALCYSQEDAEESVQEMFIYLWEKAPDIRIDISVKAYLYTSTRNYTLNIMKKNLTEQNYRNAYAEQADSEEDERAISDAQISELIGQGVKILPEKCREIFILCKMEGLTYEEISEYLKISEKTVENQMGIALRKLREYLHPKLQRILNLIIFSLFSWGGRI